MFQVSKSASDGNQNVECLKAENICHVTSSSDLPSIKEKDKRSEVAALSLAQAPVIQVPMYTINSVNSGIPVSNITCPQGVLTSAPFSQQSSQGTSVLTGSCSSDLPCQALRHGLKQAILQRRKDLGKNMIDLVKEECDRQVTLQNIQVSVLLIDGNSHNHNIKGITYRPGPPVSASRIMLQIFVAISLLKSLQF